MGGLSLSMECGKAQGGEGTRHLGIREEHFGPQGEAEQRAVGESVSSMFRHQRDDHSGWHSRRKRTGEDAVWKLIMGAGRKSGRTCSQYTRMAFHSSRNLFTSPHTLSELCFLCECLYDAYFEWPESRAVSNIFLNLLYLAQCLALNWFPIDTDGWCRNSHLAFNLLWKNSSDVPIPASCELLEKSTTFSLDSRVK